MVSIILTLIRFFGSLGPDRTADDADVHDDFRWLDPPEDLRDPNGWDQYWKDQLAHGLGPPIWDGFCNERPLISAMSRHAMTRILCAGNGISLEPRALAVAGFDVEALDISPRALEIARRFPANDRLLQHFLDVRLVRPGGHVAYVVGDILDAAKSPGPFDVVIERRTAQNYLEPDRSRVLDALAARLSPQGIFYTHCHDSGWRPPAERRHVTGDWCRAQGWSIWNGKGTKPDGRVAWLFTSTG